MNFFKKASVALLAGSSLASAQGLYSLGSGGESSESSPIHYTAGVSVGLDDNPTPIVSPDDSSVYVAAYVQGALATVTPQSTWDIYARLGYRYYLNDISAGNGNRGVPQIRAGVNYAKRFSERLRFSSRNFAAYEFEPDYTYGLAASLVSGEYFQYSSSNTVGYQWFERLGTQTGVDFSGVSYQDAQNADYQQIQFRHDFRYRATPATVYTLGYRYATTDNDGRANSNSHYYVAGVEHSINPTSAIILRGGVQVSEADGSDSFASPFIQGTLRSQLTEQLGVNGYVRYSHEPYNRSIGPNIFNESQTLRFGLRANYALNPRVGLFGGISYTSTFFDEGIGATGDATESTYNINLGARYQINDTVAVTGSYNYTQAISDDFSNREYTRNRVDIGLEASF